MIVTYRQGRKNDCRKIAELNYIASEGAIEYLFHNLVPNMTAKDVLSYGLEKDVYPHSYKSTIVAENEGQIVGSALSYPAKFHCITAELKKFLSANRLDHFRSFYLSRVEGSYFLDAICVLSKYRKKGIGKSLFEHTKKKALSNGCHELSLIEFSDNKKAIKFYRENRFEQVKSIDLKPHKLIPHNEGCVLMKCAL
ncbi:GNAT family N-acetyltransferase [Microbulbifer epialgicus]|uniref:N-acetyltransferase family protein n=1 Tax=Microbulbifer epialgicus TaxID=393907 RepID=A0ABV4P307_9GAMM